MKGDIFTMNQTTTNLSRALYERNIKNGSANLIYFSLFTIVNIVLLLVDSNLSFLFSAYIPQLMIAIGQGFAAATGSNGPLIVFSVLSVLFVGGCILSAVLSKKKTGWLILGAVLTTLDTVLMLVVVLPSIGDFLVDGLLSILFHAWILYYVFNALISYQKLKALPPDPQTYEAEYVVNGSPADPTDI